MLKRIFDIVFSLILLVALSPIFLIVSILIKLDSKGPIFFKQKRVGLKEKIFIIYKFRTMSKDAPNQGPKLTMKNDNRITHFGSLLRWLKIDEFPQLINILKGDMSFVGPRPEISSVVHQYSKNYRKVLSIKPGVTGPGQISARDELSQYPDGVDTDDYYIKFILPEKIKNDLEYVNRHSFKNDIIFILKTIFITFIQVVKLDYVIRNKKRIYAFGLDIICSIISYCLAFLIRFEGGNLSLEDYNIFLYSLPILTLCRSISFLWLDVYRGLRIYTDVNNVLNIVKAVTLSSIVFVMATFLLDFRSYSRAIVLIDWMILIILILGVRFRSKIFEKVQKTKISMGKPIMIVGAGNSGEILAKELERLPKKYNVVGFLDDDPQKLNMHIHGIPILGNLNNFSQIVKLEGIKEVFIAISTISRGKIKTLIRKCEEIGIGIKIIPSFGEAMNRISQFEKIRKIRVEDLLGRNTVNLDFSKINKFLSNKPILVTGAGGSIGSELCRQIAKFTPSAIFLLDKNENGLFFLDMELSEDYPEIKITPIVADVTDKVRMNRFFSNFKPDIVFHAAAHKHVPMMEKNPGEAFKNNVIGTVNVAQASEDFGVEKFVFISSDKAVNPTSVMGMTKRIGELYVHGLAQNRKTNYTAVRFGNVLGSSGSVVPVFRKQIERGGPVKITDPDIERYFMTTFEAAQLVIQASAIGKGGEIFVLKMGEPIKIVDLARDLISLYGLNPEKDIQIVFDGLRPGEKMYEELYISQNELKSTFHNKILVLNSKNSHFEELTLRIKKLENLLREENFSNWKAELRKIIPEFNEQNKR